jgi:hypothetical protein
MWRMDVQEMIKLNQVALRLSLNNRTITSRKTRRKRPIICSMKKTLLCVVESAGVVSLRTESTPIVGTSDRVGGEMRGICILDL